MGAIREALKKGSMYTIDFFETPFTGILIGQNPKYSVKRTKKILNGREFIEKEAHSPNESYQVLTFRSKRNTKAEKRGLVETIFENSKEHQIYFTKPIIFENSISRIDAYEWAIDQLSSVHMSKISNANMAITTKIAISMMVKMKLKTEVIEYVKEEIKSKAIEIIESKQEEWRKWKENQSNQLPFKV